MAREGYGSWRFRGTYYVLCVSVNQRTECGPESGGIACKFHARESATCAFHEDAHRTTRPRTATDDFRPATAITHFRAIIGGQCPVAVTIRLRYVSAHIAKPANPHPERLRCRRA